MSCLRINRIPIWVLLLFAVFLMIFYCLIFKDNSRGVIKQKAEHPSLFGERKIHGKFEARQTKWCLSTWPRIEKEEILSKENLFTTEERICFDNKSDFTFKLDFNIERRYSFDTFTDSVEIPDSGKREHATHTETSIPKNIHFIWNDEIVPSNFVDNLKQFKELHPKWTLHFWTLKFGRTYIEQLEPKLLPIYDGYTRRVTKADALRYVIMYHMGGAYFDLDTYPLVPLDNLTTEADCLVGPEPIENAVFTLHITSVLSNANFMCKPKHAYFRHLLNQLPLYFKHSSLFLQAGPMFFSECFNSYLKSVIKQRTESPVNIMVVRHEYFEFKTNQDTPGRMRCSTVKLAVQEYLNNCTKDQKDPENKIDGKCSTIRNAYKGRNRQVFDACVEWALHGYAQRNISRSIRYVDHVHFAAIMNPGKIIINETNNVADVIPGTILHA